MCIISLSSKFFWWKLLNVYNRCELSSVCRCKTQSSVPGKQAGRFTACFLGLYLVQVEKEMDKENILPSFGFTVSERLHPCPERTTGDVGMRRELSLSAVFPDTCSGSAPGPFQHLSKPISCNKTAD